MTSAPLSIHQRLLDQRTHGTATLLISEDLDEILVLADLPHRRHLLSGRIMDIVPRAGDGEKLWAC
ncbi:MAG: hypothetical protein H6639_10165 [Caldilineaceae bacterium]|nr:hypothetical protein [Caldilineaceae bacterium]